MTAKNTKAEQKPKAQSREPLPSIRARIDRVFDYGDSRVKASASANIGEAFAVHGLRVIDSDKGLFVSMPQNHYVRDGKDKYADIFHAVTAEARSALNGAVLDAYRQKLAEAEGQQEAPDPGPRQNM